ncbi:ceramide synthase 5 [Limosa lapponica baueri]|uniref:Ceramide synthase 5 n=1 Tax=Limosa lapponica baueri TaxID=1758121 RepID=A0A2I0T8P0_LIMLA|nr:ceramide synthase 5 [Limosa lapponica baueri]
MLNFILSGADKSPDGKRLEGLSKQLDWDVRKIQRWFRHRRNQDKPTTLTKFCESMHPGFGTHDSAGTTTLFRILNTTLFESWELIGPYPSWWLFNGLLVTLQILHVIWSYLIVRTAYKALVRGKVSKDDRSDVESSSEEEDVTSNSTKGVFSTSSNGSNRINGHVASGQWTEEE